MTTDTYSSYSLCEEDLTPLFSSERGRSLAGQDCAPKVSRHWHRTGSYRNKILLPNGFEGQLCTTWTVQSPGGDKDSYSAKWVALGSPDETHTEQPNAPIHNQQQACHPVLTREPRGDGKFLLAQLSHVLITSYQFLSAIYKQEKLLQCTQACATLSGTSSGPSICCSAGNSHPVSHTPEPFVTLSSGWSSTVGCISECRNSTEKRNYTANMLARCKCVVILMNARWISKVVRHSCPVI